jgi:hypothetical protein
MATELEPMTRICRVCDAPYQVVKPWQKSCSAKCNSIVNNGRRRTDPGVKRCRTCLQHLPVADFELAHRSCRACEELQASGRKRCTKCREIKEHAAFHVRPTRPDGYESSCRSCKSEASRRRNANPEKKRVNRDNKLRLKYGIGIEDVDAMYELQQGRCGICQTPKGVERLHVDHDHSTGAVRSLLCLNCNSMLGHAKDSMAVLRAAILYLERHSDVPDVQT